MATRTSNLLACAAMALAVTAAPRTAGAVPITIWHAPTRVYVQYTTPPPFRPTYRSPIERSWARQPTTTRPTTYGYGYGNPMLPRVAPLPPAVTALGARRFTTPTVITPRAPISVRVPTVATTSAVASVRWAVPVSRVVTTAFTTPAVATPTIHPTTPQHVALFWSRIAPPPAVHRP